MTFSSFYLFLLLESFSQFSTLFYFLLLRHLPCFVIFIAILVLFATIITLLIGFLGLPPPLILLISAFIGCLHRH